MDIWAMLRTAGLGPATVSGGVGEAEVEGVDLLNTVQIYRPSSHFLRSLPIPRYFPALFLLLGGKGDRIFEDSSIAERDLGLA
jgi:hypothetical protein